MTLISYFNAQNRLKKLIDKVNDDQDAITITTKNNNAVLISESEYKQYKETIYLLNNPANAKRLAESIDQLENKKTIEINE